MKRISTIFLQVVIVLVRHCSTCHSYSGSPRPEGRAKNLDLFSIYADPFILYGYAAASVPFFVALYKAFKLLGYIGQNRLFSPNAVKALKNIKYAAILLNYFNRGGWFYT